jgi:Ca2+-binding EF-hand superfamily protein
MATALKIQGRQGRWEIVNGVYEPMGQQHNQRQVWCARSVQPVYIFHTGKSRWVISKRIDDGAKCYCFIKDTDSESPAKVQGDWVCCDQDGEWRADTNMSCTGAHASNDKFVQLRMTIDGELNTYGINDINSLRTLWKRLDFNGNNVVSLAEIDKMVVEMVAGGTFPAWLNNKPALMRAYKKTILKDGDGDDWVEKKEFHALMLNIFWFNKLWQVFEIIDSEHDRRISMSEFQQGMRSLGLNLNSQEAMDEFNKMDTNHGGQVLFVEFCAYIRHRVNPDSNPNLDGDIVSGENCGKVMRKAHGHKATHTHFVTKKSLAFFDELEGKIKGIMKDKTKLKEMWKRIDFNGNNIVSLAEIDKLAVEAYPLLNHKPALMRAYKATINAPSANNDDWVNKKEFKMLLGNLFYFNKLFWLFEHVDADQDRRLTYAEFKKCLTVANTKMSEAEMRNDFQKVDRNGGGIILFDEFCKYFTMKACPECMSELVD